MDRKKDEIAWCAGIYEGEGFIGHGKKNGTSVQLIIPMTDLEPLQEFQRITGVGKVVGPYPCYFKGKRVKDKWVYGCYNFEHTQYLIAMFWNYLSPRRRDQAKAVLTGMKHHYAKSYVRTKYGKKITELSDEERKEYGRWKQANRKPRISPPR